MRVEFGWKLGKLHKLHTLFQHGFFPQKNRCLPVVPVYLSPSASLTLQVVDVQHLEMLKGSDGVMVPLHF